MADGDRSFPSPFDIETPAGAEGWERLYPYYMLFGEDRREVEENQFWFHDSMHYPKAMFPFDMVMPEQTHLILNQNTTRYMVVPTAKGIDHRIVNGRVYISPNLVTETDEIERRAALFEARAGHYFANWRELYDQWVEKAKATREELESLEFPPLPDEEPLERVQAGEDRNSAFGLIATYNRLLENIMKIGHLHFEMLGLGYGAYVTFGDFCRQMFPDIRDQTVAQMVAGIDILMFRPDDELKRLARLAVDLGVAEPIKAGGSADEVLAAVGALDGGERWTTELEGVREPWFWFATGAGMTHEDPAWNDDLRVPLELIATYVEKVEAGEEIERPLETVETERDRVTAEYRELLPSDQDRKAFDELVALARMVYPFVENHNFYCEHQHHTRLWNKIRELGEVFATAGFFESAEDIWYLSRYEVYGAIWDMLTGWATQTPDARAHWTREIAERKRILDALNQWSPPPALGAVPEAMTEPFTVMLWGVNDETIQRWLGAGDGDDSGELLGVAASPGVAEGVARVIFSPAELDLVQQDEILVCPITAPSWAPVFTKISAAVSDIGGIMAHAAIVSREYGLPAVVGTGFGTKSIKTGQTVRVDGSRGIVTVIE
ncbi:MAG: PEP-utilizing protein mobile subunit [Actinobacteria bacterium]|nr:PEP-utilizing protein mobile subunit [Actinomycetota bacterium]